MIMFTAQQIKSWRRFDIEKKSEALDLYFQLYDRSSKVSDWIFVRF